MYYYHKPVAMTDLKAKMEGEAGWNERRQPSQNSPQCWALFHLTIARIRINLLTDLQENPCSLRDFETFSASKATKPWILLH